MSRNTENNDEHITMYTIVFSPSHLDMAVNGICNSLTGNAEKQNLSKCKINMYPVLSDLLI